MTHPPPSSGEEPAGGSASNTGDYQHLFWISVHGVVFGVRPCHPHIAVQELSYWHFCVMSWQLGSAIYCLNSKIHTNF